MLNQSVLPFKLETTDDVLTPHGGLALFGEFCAAMKLSNEVNRHLPAPGSGNGFAPGVYVQPLVLMLHGGGRLLEDMRMLASDNGLKPLLGMTVPSPDATGNWLRRMGLDSGLSGLRTVHKKQLKWAMKREDWKDYTLDIDASQIVAEKRDAHYTYKGEKGYMPMVGHLAENGLVVHDEFREGNEAPASRNLAFVRACKANMPKGKRIARLRADSAAYQADVINDCENDGVMFAIGAKQDVAVKAAIAAIPESDWQPYSDGEIASTVHCMNATEAFTLVVFRKGRQLSLNGEGSEWFYHAIAANSSDDAASVMDWYRLRGECSENRIKELKLGFGMERMPCGQFAANAVFFRIGAMAYNLFVMFKTHVLPKEWKKHQVQTVRWRLYQIAARITRHARSLWMHISGAHIALFRDIRLRCSQIAFA
ncbi:MAG: IS1380 family transposase [Mariprofundaceae bacterium]|nr:IS1380 family transposase [Mariprofundaceae bacterium]